MNQIEKLMIGLCIVAGPFLVSCGGDDPVTCNYTTELEVELNALISASQTYSLDPTIANCEAYKSSMQAYLDEADDYSTCAFNAGQSAEYQLAIDQQQDALDALVCQ